MSDYEKHIWKSKNYAPSFEAHVVYVVFILACFTLPLMVSFVAA